MKHIKSLKLLFGFFLALMAVSTSVVGADGKYLVYIGTYTHGQSKGIYAYRMDSATGTFTALGLAAETPDPTFLDIDHKHKFLYAANEIGNFQGKHAGAVSAFSIDADTGKLTLLNQRSTIGSGPCHVLVDGQDRNVLAANYGSGSIAVLPIRADGGLSEASAFIQHAGKGQSPDRQDGPHAHCMALDAANRFAFACDLGLDEVLVYRFDPQHGTLVPNQPPFASIKPGSGPRHFEFAPDGRHAYVINELGSTITVFAYRAGAGTLKELQTVSTLPDDFHGNNTTAEIQVHPSGKFVYGSNRGHNSIAAVCHRSRKGERSRPSSTNPLVEKLRATLASIRRESTCLRPIRIPTPLWFSALIPHREN